MSNRTFGAKSEAFLFMFTLIRKSPAVIPLVEACLPVGAPFDEVRREHELEITVTTALMNDVVILKPFQGAVKRFGIEIERFGKIFFGGTDKTGLVVSIKSQPEEDAQSSSLQRVFQQIVALFQIESHKSFLQ